MTIRNRKLLTGFAASALIAVASTPSLAERPDVKGCPGEITWDSFVMGVLATLGFNVGEHIQDNCL